MRQHRKGITALPHNIPDQSHRNAICSVMCSQYDSGYGSECGIEQRDAVDRASVSTLIIEQAKVRSRSELGLMEVSVRYNCGIRCVIRIIVYVSHELFGQSLAKDGECRGIKYMQRTIFQSCLDCFDLLCGSLSAHLIACSKYGAQLILEEMM